MKVEAIFIGGPLHKTLLHIELHDTYHYSCRELSTGENYVAHYVPQFWLDELNHEWVFYVDSALITSQVEKAIVDYLENAVESTVVEMINF